MSDAVLVALISGAVTLLGVLASNAKIIGVLQQKIEDLTYEVRKHNGFAERIPKLEAQTQQIERRLDKMEQTAKPGSAPKKPGSGHQQPPRKGA